MKKVLMVVMAFMGAVIIEQADMEVVKAASATTDYFMCRSDIRN